MGQYFIFKSIAEATNLFTLIFWHIRAKAILFPGIASVSSARCTQTASESFKIAGELLTAVGVPTRMCGAAPPAELGPWQQHVSKARRVMIEKDYQVATVIADPAQRNSMAATILLQVKRHGVRIKTVVPVGFSTCIFVCIFPIAETASAVLAPISPEY